MTCHNVHECKMRFMESKIFSSDILVIGSGIAGLTFAIKASKYATVNIVTKKKNFDSNTNYAQGGIASVLAPGDKYEYHINDTLQAGAGLCNQKAVEFLVINGPDRIKELIEWGANFSYDNNTRLELGREGGHSQNRIVHSYDLTGKEVERALIAKIEEIPNINIFENHTAVDLLTEHQLGGKENISNLNCYGAYVLENESGNIHTYKSKYTIIASGGAGGVYLHTTNPEVATGDGITIAYRAGALIGDMEFMQFHPTTFYSEKLSARSLLISEAVRGEGAVLFTKSGTRFMENIHPLKELAPRDIVARAIDKELKTNGEDYVYLDISFKDADFLRRRFPFIYENCLAEGVDITREPIPVVPAAHYLCGGIITDLNARTSIRNLYTAGESACTGVHGSNRLASNSLLEALVFSHAAAIDIENKMKISNNTEIPEFPSWNKGGTFDLEEWILIQHNVDEIKRLMWDYVGIVRSDLRLQRAYRRILFLEEEIIDYYKRCTVSLDLLELRNLATIARLIIQGAINRKESRGLHYNKDFPDTSKDFEKCIIQKNSFPLIFEKLESVEFE